MMSPLERMIKRLRDDLNGRLLSFGELVSVSEEENAPFGEAVVAEAIVRERKSEEEILNLALAAFQHNFEALEIGLTSGRSFLLGTVGMDLATKERALIDDALINHAVTYTLATEVGNHEIGLQPCAGTGDSCPYTGLLHALQQTGVSERKLAYAAAIMLKLGSFFRVGKKTTGCNMEGFGAGAAATAAALTDLRGGTARQVARAIVLALSPTIAVPCTPRVMVHGLCATHIGGAILIGNLASNLVLKTSLPVDVDIDVMLAMAARIHVEAAPVITSINLEYLEPYFAKKPQIEPYVDGEIRAKEKESAETIQVRAREEVRNMLNEARPLTGVLGDVVVGGSSMAVGSPANMARICHAMTAGTISRIEIDLTADLFSRRAINVPAILMAAIYGTPTGDADMYKRVLDLPELKHIQIKVNRIEEPQVQRIRIEASEKSAMLDARNRGGGRVAIIQAEPSVQEALDAAKRLGIEVAQ
jgi:L-serine dehydratase